MPLERGNDEAVAAHIVDGLDSQDLRMPVAEELLRLLEHLFPHSATAARRHGPDQNHRTREDEGVKHAFLYASAVPAVTCARAQPSVEDARLGRHSGPQRTGEASELGLAGVRELEPLGERSVATVAGS